MTKTPAIKPFKSDRAAKMAMTKAERAYNEAQTATGGYYGRCVQDPNNHQTTEEILADLRKLEALRDQAHDYAAAVYEQARSQGFWVKSWCFGYNPTRDLIHANID